jgi:hypothetical protein
MRVMALFTFDPSLNVALPSLALLDTWGCSASLATKSLPSVSSRWGRFDHRLSRARFVLELQQLVRGKKEFRYSMCRGGVT